MLMQCVPVRTTTGFLTRSLCFIPKRVFCGSRPNAAIYVACNKFRDIKLFRAKNEGRCGILPLYSKPVLVAEKYSFSTKSDKSDSSEERSEDPIAAKNKTLFQRFKESFRKYWYVLVPVHFVTSLSWFGFFYYLASLGVNPVPLLEKLGTPEEWIQPLRGSKVGYVATAYALYKLATPARYAVTLGVTGLTVRFLGNRGLLKDMSFKKPTKV